MRRMTSWFLAVLVVCFLSLEKLTPVNAQEQKHLYSVMPNDHIVGNPDAIIIFIEYADLNCPACGAAHNTMQQIVDVYAPGQVAWVMRHFPFLSASSKQEAEAAECAAHLGEKTDYWKYINLAIRSRQSTSAQLVSFANRLHLDREQFEQCLSADSEEYRAVRQKVASDFEGGRLIRVRATPTFIILVQGAEPYTIEGFPNFDTVKNYINEKLAEHAQ